MYHAAKCFSKQVCILLNKEIGSEEFRELFEKVADCSEKVCSINISENNMGEFVLLPDVRQNCVSSLISGNTTIDDESEDEVGGAAGLILECLRSCDADIREIVIENIIVCGGGVMIPGVLNVYMLLLTHI